MKMGAALLVFKFFFDPRAIDFMFSYFFSGDGVRFFPKFAHILCFFRPISVFSS